MNTEAKDRIGDVYAVACTYSREARELLAEQDRDCGNAEPPGCGDEWSELITQRTTDGRAAAVRSALAELVRCAPEADRAAAKSITKELRRAVEALAQYRPDVEPCEVVIPAALARRYFGARGRVVLTNYRPTPAAVEELDALRRECRIMLVACEEAFTKHPDPMSRLLGAAARTALVLFGAEGETLAEWCEALAAGDAA